MPFRLNPKLILLLFLPVLLALLIFWLDPRPKPLPGKNGPAGIAAPPTAIAFSKDGLLVCASTNGNVQMYLPEERRWRSFTVLPGPRTFSSVPINKLIFSADGKQLFASIAQEAYAAISFDPQTRKSQYSFNGSTTGVFDLSPDGNWTADGDSTGVKLRNLGGKWVMPPHANPYHRNDYRFYRSRTFDIGTSPSSISFSPDSKTLAVGYFGIVALIPVRGSFKQPTHISDLKGNVLTFKPQLTPAQNNSNPFWLEWSPDGSKLAAYSYDEIVIFDRKLQKLASGALPASLTRTNMIAGGLNGLSNGGANLVWSQDSQTLYSGGDEVRRWRVSDMSLERTFGVASPVALSPDGTKLITANPNKNAPYPYLVQWKVG